MPSVQMILADVKFLFHESIDIEFHCSIVPKKFTVVSFVHPSNAEKPILVTLAGIFIFVKLVHSLNA